MNQASNGTLIEDNHAQDNAGEPISGDPGLGSRVLSSTNVAVIENNAHDKATSTCAGTGQGLSRSATTAG